MQFMRDGFVFYFVTYQTNTKLYFIVLFILINFIMSDQQGLYKILYISAMGNRISSLPHQKNFNPNFSFLNSTLVPFVVSETRDKPQFVLQKWQYEPISQQMLDQFLVSHPFPHHQLIQSSSYIQIQTFQKGQSLLQTRYYFPSLVDYNNFLTGVLNLKNSRGIKLYTELNQIRQKRLFCVDLELKYNGIKMWRKAHTLDTLSKIDILIMCCKLADEHKVLRVDPEDMIIQDEKYYLTNIVYDDQFANRVLDVITLWLFSPNQLMFQEILNFDELQTSELIKQLQIPTLLQTVLARYSSQEATLSECIQYLEGIVSRSAHTAFRMDSLQACFYYRYQQIYSSSMEWIYFKESNNIYFYQVSDKHGHITSLIRKKNKIFLDDVSIMLDQKEYQVIIPRKGTRHFVKADQFQLHHHSSISDITLYQNLPIKIQNGKIFRMENEILILQKNMYRMDPKNKTIREVYKQVPREAIVGILREKGEPFIIKQSKDFLKQGIKVVGKQFQISLQLVTTELYQSFLSGVVLNLDEADFCLQCFSGVFILFACRSLWILDFNLRCFFSYASLEQIKYYPQNKISQPQVYNYMFVIQKQPFIVQFIRHQNSTSSMLKNNHLFILGWRSDEPVCMEYLFQPFSGSLIMQACVSLGYNNIPNFIQLPQAQIEQRYETTKHLFKVEPNEVFLYKYQQWKLYGDDFLKIYQSFIQSSEFGGYNVKVIAEKIEKSLLQQLKSRSAQSKPLTKKQTFLMIRRVLQIYSSLHFLGIPYRGFTIASLFFTASNQLKLRSWTLPPRLGYISDFKDLFTVIFNIITNNYEDTLTQKIVESYQKKLGEYPEIQKMIMKYTKLAVTQERRDDMQKTMQQLKQHIEVELLKQIESRPGNLYIFRYQINSSRLYAMQISEKRLIRLQILHDMNDLWSFGVDDICIWNQNLSVLYLLTSKHFLSIKIDFQLLQDKQELSVKAQLEESIPKNIFKPTLCLLPSTNTLYSFGGIEIDQQQETNISKSVFIFNPQQRRWQQKQSLCCSLAGASALHSSDEKLIYLLGGVSSDYRMDNSNLKVLIYNVENGSSILHIDIYHKSPFENSLNCPLVFLFSSGALDQVFVFYENEGKNHKVTMMEMESGGILFNYNIQQKQALSLQQKKNENQQDKSMTSKRARIVKFNNDSTKKQGYSRRLHRRPQQMSLSTKDKSIYLLDNNNRLLVTSFKTGTQGVIDVFNMG